MADYTISGKGNLPDDVLPLIGTWFIGIPSSNETAVDSDGSFRSGVLEVETDDQGNASVTLPGGSGAWYAATFEARTQRRGRTPQLGPFYIELTGNKKWGDLIGTTSSPDLTPPLVAQAQAAAAAASASASAASGSASAASGAVSAVITKAGAADGQVAVYSEADGKYKPGAGGDTLTIPTQAEAEAGTATTGRKWTAQRVWQAIAAALPSTATGRAVLAAADKAAARTAAGFVTGTPGTGEVQLVDAATLNKVKSFGLSAPPVIGSSLAVVNSTAETIIGTWTIADGDLLAGDVLSLVGTLDVLNNSGAAATAQWRIRVGGLTGAVILASTAVSHASTGNRYRWVWDLKALLVALNDHRWGGFVHQAFASSGEVFNNGVNSALMPTALATADLSGNTTLVLTAQLGTAAATIDCRSRGFELSRRRP